MTALARLPAATDRNPKATELYSEAYELPVGENALASLFHGGTANASARFDVEGVPCWRPVLIAPEHRRFSNSSPFDGGHDATDSSA